MNNINLDSAKDTLCKNILIYGYCKFENKGCAFNHTQPPPPTPQVTATMAPDGKRKFNLNTPSFQPGVAPGAPYSPGSKDAAAPLASGASAADGGGADIGARDHDAHAASAHASANSAHASANSANSAGAGGANINAAALALKKFNVLTPLFTPLTNLYGGGATLATPPPQQVTPTPGLPNPYSMAGEMYFGGHPGAGAGYPLQYHLYAPAPPPRLQMALPPYETSASAMFIANDLRQELQRRNEATLQTIPRLALPEHVHVYHLLVPIDRSYDALLKTWRVALTVYKLFLNVDGNPYALRRLDLPFDIVDDGPLKFVKKWRGVKNANVVHVHDAFTSYAFGGERPQLIVAYDYYPNSLTLWEHHKRLVGRSDPVTEETLWVYLVQLVNALQAIHSHELAARLLMEVHKIIVTLKNRVRLAGCGIADILAAGTSGTSDKSSDTAADTSADANLVTSKDTIRYLQRRDIERLGRVLLDLCSLTLPPAQRNNQPAELLRLVETLAPGHFSREFLQVLTTLNTSLDDVPEFDLAAFTQRHLTLKMMGVINALEDQADYAESQLTLELENARLFRLMAKLNFVIDRPEQKDWLENGPKYIVKLFRDYIFFQYDEFGKPVVDLARVLTNLNKLDAGIDEKFLLVSRDEKNCIIVSYKEIRDTIDSLFRNLTRD